MLSSRAGRESSSPRSPATARALTAEQNTALATTPADELLYSRNSPARPGHGPPPRLPARQARNSLRVMAEAVRWGKRGARINTISPGIIFTPLARDELTGPRGEGYRRMIELCPPGAAEPRRGRNRWRAADGPRRRVHYRQRLPHGRRGHRLLLVRRARGLSWPKALPDDLSHFKGPPAHSRRRGSPSRSGHD